MPKCLPVDPSELRAPGAIRFKDIPVNAYHKTLADEREKLGDENLVRIWRDIAILREFESMLNQIKTQGVYNGIETTYAPAVSDGKVKSVVETNLEGWVVTIEHADGLVSIYKGLDREGLAAEGAAVKTGDSIGKLAETMMLEQLDGVHLHLEMKKNGALVNPLDYLPEAGSEK